VRGNQINKLASAAAATSTDAAAGASGLADSETDSGPPTEQQAAGDTGEPVATTEPVKEEAAPPIPVRERQTVAVSSLTRVKYVAPKYPRSAERRNISGWVDVVFTVTMDGSVKDVEATKSEPGDTFVLSATRAVERWVFEPIIEEGETVEKRAGVRMMFALE